MQEGDTYEEPTQKGFKRGNMSPEENFTFSQPLVEYFPN